MNPLKFLSRGGASEPTDENFENTVLLLHGDGNQGATNFSNTGPTKYMAFTDNSTNNFPITVNGDAYGDNFSPFSRDEGAWSNFFDGSGDYLSLANNAAFQFGTGDFTVELWFNASALFASGRTGLYFSGGSTGGGFAPTNTAMEWDVFGVGPRVSYAFVPTLGRWYHLSYSRSGTTAYLGIDGTIVATGTDSTNYTFGGVTIGSVNAGQYFNGYISNVRVVKGTAVYTSNFTPSTTPLTAISGTSLLTCQSNRFKDNSSNAFAITRNGDVAVSPFTPFTVTPNTTDGSGYFDGTGDFLTIADSATLEPSNSDFTIECWIYPQATGSFLGVFSKRPDNSTAYSPVQVLINNGTMGLYASTTGSSWAVSANASTSPPLNAWSHIAVVRNGTASNNLVLYLNGVSVATGSVSNTALSDNAGAWAIGADSDDGGGNFNGYISSFRYVKGTAVYTSAFTPPSAPSTSVANTQLLTCQYQGTVRNVGFIDSSPYDHRITRVGNTTQGSFSPFSKPDGRWGNYFDGTGDSLSTTSVSASGTGDFTYEAWIYPVAFTNSLNIIFDHRSGGLHTSGMFMYVSNTGALGVYNVTVSTNTLTLHTWNHIAFVRSSGTLTYYINGVSGGSQSFTRNNTDTLFYICMPNDGASNLSAPCYLSNVRYTKSAVYTSGFTPSTTPLTAIANTQLLTCQSNRFIDNSTNNFTITRNGDVRVTPFSPFPITTAYDPAVNGGSGYFDGSGDTLSIAYNAALQLTSATAFTIEGFVYFNNTSSQQYVVSNWATGGTGYAIATGVSTFANTELCFYDGATWRKIGNVTAGQWYHFAVVSSGTSNSAYMYLSGVQTAGAFTVSSSISNGSSSLFLMSQNNSSAYLNGYLSNYRLVKGTNLYPSGTTFTPPTAPVTAIANTSFLCNFTNAGIFDNTGFNNLETVGNAQIDTSVKKYGTGAMKFDPGQTNPLVIPHTDLLNLSSGDFTIEAWVYLNANRTFNYIISKGGASTREWAVNVGPTNLFFYWSTNGTSDSTVSGSATLPTSTWMHIAVTRAGNSIRLFKDGTQVGSTGTFTSMYSGTSPVYVGRFMDYNNISHDLSGFIDDLRITKGIARYTSNFTPPTAALPDIGT